MCGLILTFKADNNITEKALNKIAHRGPDGSKIISLPSATLGFVRLAINDYSENGMQPFSYQHLTGIFNGEIYNYRELIQQFDLNLKSECDTEVILPIFSLKNRNILHHLDGFFSGIIYDHRKKAYYTLRDHIGKKPLFWAKTDTRQFICSELKAIDNIIDFKIIPKGLCQINAQGEINLLARHEPIETNIELKTGLKAAVKKRLPVSDRFGIFLSGGIDSSIVALLARQTSTNCNYYTLGSEDSQDLYYVFKIADFLGIKNDLNIIPLPNKKALTGLIDKIVYHTESYNPSIISNGLATYLLAKAARTDGLKTVLTGEGADEVFCGYPIPGGVDIWYSKREELLENLHFTELRRSDLAAMAHAIEIRCPFLDRAVIAQTNKLDKDYFIKQYNGKLTGKIILRELFKNDLPDEIVLRPKTSFDVGSGVRKLVVEHLQSDGKRERDALRDIWTRYFPASLADKAYFHAYPTFDEAIEKRGIVHNNVS